MKILLTNDDGIEALGLLGLAKAMESLGEVTIVAPSQGCSCCGHSVTTTRPIVYRCMGPNRYSVDGFPADCVRVALMELNLRPDWIVSGVNHGGNLGIDIQMSGTVAAAREGSQLGFRSIAMSQYRKQEVEVDWDVTGQRASDLFRWLSDRTLAEGHFWNVNLPAIDPSHAMPPAAVCSPEPASLKFALESSAEGLIYRSNYHARSRTAGSDVDICFSGLPSVSLLRNEVF